MCITTLHSPEGTPKGLNVSFFGIYTRLYSRSVESDLMIFSIFLILFHTCLTLSSCHHCGNTRLYADVLNDTDLFMQLKAIFQNRVGLDFLTVFALFSWWAIYRFMWSDSIVLNLKLLGNLRFIPTFSSNSL